MTTRAAIAAVTSETAKAALATGNLIVTYRRHNVAAHGNTVGGSTTARTTTTTLATLATNTSITTIPCACFGPVPTGATGTTNLALSSGCTNPTEPTGNVIIIDYYTSDCRNKQAAS